jgi:hypothetical protein
MVPEVIKGGQQTVNPLRSIHDRDCSLSLFAIKINERNSDITSTSEVNGRRGFKA